MHVCFARTEVATLDGVLKQTIDAVAVTLVILGGVDSTLCCNGVRATWRVMKGKCINLIAQLGKRCSSRCSCKTSSNNNDFELALVVRVYKLCVCFVVVPLFMQRTSWDFGVKRVHKSYFTIPAITAIGNDTLPTTTMVAKPVAKPRRQLLNRGLFQPRD